VEYLTDTVDIFCDRKHVLNTFLARYEQLCGKKSKGQAAPVIFNKSDLNQGLEKKAGVDKLRKITPSMIFTFVR